MTFRILLLGLLIAAAPPVHTADRVSIHVSPAVGFAPANLVVRATVDANAENRSLEILAESADFYRSSEIALDGSHAPRVTLWRVNSVPRGRYEVRAVLRGVEGREIAVTTSEVEILSEEDLTTGGRK